MDPEDGTTPEPTNVLEAHMEATPGQQHTWEALKVSSLVWVILSVLALESSGALVKGTGCSLAS